MVPPRDNQERVLTLCSGIFIHNAAFHKYCTFGSLPTPYARFGLEHWWTLIRSSSCRIRYDLLSDILDDSDVFADHTQILLRQFFFYCCSQDWRNALFHTVHFIASSSDNLSCLIFFLWCKHGTGWLGLVCTTTSGITWRHDSCTTHNNTELAYLICIVKH